MPTVLEEQMWNAGKRGVMIMVLITLLPVLLPSVFIASVLIFTSVLPLICIIAALCYLLKEATVLMHRHQDAESTETPSLWSSLIPETLFGFFREKMGPMDMCKERDLQLDVVLVCRRFNQAGSTSIASIMELESEVPLLDQADRSMRVLPFEGFPGLRTSRARASPEGQPRGPKFRPAPAR
ncbi:hypothetical protein R1sor_001180 [Riccia sorocarpa]|uniref:Uncharacterized protein n=1 Tax=Riccia sorocarpa TaxID=122646 RepID=A0ABD3GVJ3_9MARC